MYHGRKREDEPKELSPEELKKKEELAVKITSMLAEFLEIRHGKKEVENPLEFCNIMVQLCPEIPHVYNFRREILLKKFESLSLQESYKMVGEEIKLTMLLLKKRPKCYAIWSHRQWLILKSFEQENLILKETKQEISPRMVEQDLMICSKMLQMDERNFHAWNYRIWLIRDVLKYNKKLVEEELEYLKSKIEDNFSNFSAFHFRQKHFTVKHQQLLHKEVEDEILNYYITESEIEEELEMVKNAIYIQPNEQGVWQYYRWLISLQIPFQVFKANILSTENSKISIKFISTQKISNFTQNIKIDNENIKISKLYAQNSSENKEEQQFSYTYLAELDNPQNIQEFSIQIVSNTEIKDNNEEKVNFCSESNLNKQNLIPSLFKVNLESRSSNLQKPDEQPEILQKIQTLLEQENEFLNEVIESEPENGFSIHHQNFMFRTQIQIEFLSNQGLINKNFTENTQKIIDNIVNLQKTSVRQINYLKIQENKYQIVKDMFNEQEKFQFNRLYDAKNFEIQEFIPFIQSIQQQS